MLTIGAHLSIAKGYAHMGKEAHLIGANTFQFFTRNPRGGSSKAIDLDDIKTLNAFMADHSFGPILAHAPYTMNPCAADEKVLAFAKIAMLEDLERLKHLPTAYYNFHPGSHVKQGVDIGIEKIIQLLNDVLTENCPTKILLETMAGKGSEVGRTFEELARIINGVQHNHLMGVCLDTCHVYDAGYDIVEDLDGVLEKFDQIIGLDRLYAIHLNDSKNPFNSHKDRHEKIGKGTLGIETIQKIVTHPKLKHLPFFLETPSTVEEYRDEIMMIRGL